MQAIHWCHTLTLSNAKLCNAAATVLCSEWLSECAGSFTESQSVRGSKVTWTQAKFVSGPLMLEVKVTVTWAQAQSVAGPLMLDSDADGQATS